VIAACDTPFIYWARSWQVPVVADEPAETGTQATPAALAPAPAVAQPVPARGSPSSPGMAQ
jgi:hypothetical protein